MSNIDSTWIPQVALDTLYLRWRGSHPPCIGSDCLQYVRADRAAGVEYWCLSPFTVRTQECVGAGEIKPSLKHRGRESGEWTDRVGGSRPCLWPTLKNTHTHKINLHWSLSRTPVTSPAHALHFFCITCCSPSRRKRKKKKRMKTPCSTRVATQNEFCSTSVALSGKGSVFTTLLQVQY